jgi:hypothetical protein
VGLGAAIPARAAQRALQWDCPKSISSRGRSKRHTAGALPPDSRTCTTQAVRARSKESEVPAAGKPADALAGRTLLAASTLSLTACVHASKHLSAADGLNFKHAFRAQRPTSAAGNR